MEELTIEEKAKAYDEALEIARKLYNSEETSADVEIACETIFPELTEPEDERIRKKLIEFFKDWGKRLSHCWGLSIPDILAWLEKQGEKPQGKTALEAAKEEKINILEVKEVDLKIAIDKWIDDTAITHEDCSTAKHFFELGLKTRKGE